MGKDKFAIIGLSAHLPEAENISKFWENLVNGRECVKNFSSKSYGDNYVPAKAVIDSPFGFSAEFFKISPAQAERMDPQIRHLIECLWECCEDAGINIHHLVDSQIGVYATTSSQFNYREEYLKNRDDSPLVDYQDLVANGRDFVATRLAYEFGFKGPAINIQTACSSGLVAVTYACDDLMSRKCDIAFVAAMSITFPSEIGYFYIPGMIFSKDGHCRPFDDNATGIIPGNGGGVVMIKRLADAIESNDNIYAVIEGYAINNDGKEKLGFTAPSYQGQVALLNKALLAAGIEKKQMCYIEAHGTGTVLGDQVELEAISDVYANQDDHEVYIGSVKSNLGHLDVVSGLVGLLKAVLCLKNEVIPPTINVRVEHKKLREEGSVVKLANTSVPMSLASSYIGVSSFGVGGTNAHVILSKYKEVGHSLGSDSTSESYLLKLSALSENDLLMQKDNLIKYLHESDLPLANIISTLQVGRFDFPVRESFLVKDKVEAIKHLYLSSFSESSHEQKNINYTPNLFVVIDLASFDIRQSISSIYMKNDIFSSVVDQCLLYFNRCRIPFDIHLDDQSILYKFVLMLALSFVWKSWLSSKVTWVGIGICELIVACLSDHITIEDALGYVKENAKIRENCKLFDILVRNENTYQVLGFYAGEMAYERFNSPNYVTISVPANSVSLFEEYLNKNGIIFIENNYLVSLHYRSLFLQDNYEGVYYQSPGFIYYTYTKFDYCKMLLNIISKEGSQLTVLGFSNEAIANIKQTLSYLI